MIAVLIALVVGIGLGYGFRGLINREGKKVEADVKQEAGNVAGKL